MLGDFAIEDLFSYLLKRESTQFFVSMAIRTLAMGMVSIFEPVYLYIFFGRSLAHVLFFWAAYSGIFAIFVVLGGRSMERFGLKKTMLLSNFFFFAFYICLFFADVSIVMLPLAILARAFGAALFWPAFHTDFIRFTKGENRAKGVSKMSVVSMSAGIISPVVGGLILAGLGYPGLFTVVLVTLFASSFPLFLSKERYEVYTDSYKQAWARIRKNKDMSFALGSLSIEAGIDFFIWPVFLFTLGISYRQLGSISTFALFVATFFAWYMGKLATQKDKNLLLNIGSVMLAIACFLQVFVRDVISAFLAQNLYRISKTFALIPFRTILYNKAASKKTQADEYIIYREIIIHIIRFFCFMILGTIFLIFPAIRIKYIFIISAIAALGYSFLAKPRLFSVDKLFRKS